MVLHDTLRAQQRHKIFCNISYFIYAKCLTICGIWGGNCASCWGYNTSSVTFMHLSMWGHAFSNRDVTISKRHETKWSRYEPNYDINSHMILYKNMILELLLLSCAPLGSLAQSIMFYVNSSSQYSVRLKRAMSWGGKGGGKTCYF